MANPEGEGRKDWAQETSRCDAQKKGALGLKKRGLGWPIIERTMSPPRYALPDRVEIALGLTWAAYGPISVLKHLHFLLDGTGTSCQRRILNLF